MSVRHSPADPLALLPWAKEEVFSFYPEASQLRALKLQVDPEGKFSNELWAKYL